MMVYFSVFFYEIIVVLVLVVFVVVLVKYSNVFSIFRIERCSETETHIEFAEGATRTPKNGVKVRLRLRED